MLLDRPERIGFNPDEALVLLEHRNLKTEYNRFLEVFRDFVNAMEKIEIHGSVNTTVFARLQKLIRESKTITEFAKKIALDYIPNVDEKINEIQGAKSELKKDTSRALFTAESEEKILKHIK